MHSWCPLAKAYTIAGAAAAPAMSIFMMTYKPSKLRHYVCAARLKLSKAYCPTKHIIGHIGDGFFHGSNDPTNSVKALKEDIL